MLVIVFLDMLLFLIVDFFFITDCETKSLRSKEIERNHKREKVYYAS